MTTTYDPIDPTLGDPRIHKPYAEAALERAKAANAWRTCELRIDERTTILVEKRNFNRAYAEAYKAKLDKRTKK